MATRENFGPNKEVRRAEAMKRAELRGALSPAQQLAVLDKRLGAGVGAMKERARLTKLIEK